MSWNMQALQTSPWIIHLCKQKRTGSKNLPIHDLLDLVLKNLTPTDLLLGERDFRQPELLDLFFLKKKKEHKPVWLCNKLPSTWYPTIRSSSVQLMFMDTNGFLHDIKLEAGHVGKLINCPVNCYYYPTPGSRKKENNKTYAHLILNHNN